MTLTVDDDRVAGLPPSAKLVYLVLENADEDSLRFTDVRDRTRLPDGTAHNALCYLHTEGVVERRADPVDSRRVEYRLVTPGEFDN